MHANRETPRQRLLSAMVEVCAADGFERATVAMVIGHAGVSRRTFYRHFASKSDCLLTAAAEIERRLLESTEAAVQKQTDSTIGVVIAALVMFAQERPGPALVLMSETMAAGRAGLATRDHAVDRLAALGQGVIDVDPADLGPPAGVLIGALFRVLASRLRRGELDQQSLTDELVHWARSYEKPGAAEPVAALTSTSTSARTSVARRQLTALRAPPAARARRHKDPGDAVSEDQRLAVMFALAEVVRRDGYPNATVAAITHSAGVDGRIFYALFADKPGALMALHEFAFQHAWAATAGGFFTAEDWPERIWQAAGTFTEFLDRNPILTYTSLVENAAGGPDATRRFEELLAGFTIFLRDGYQYPATSGRRGPSPAALEAIAHADHEMLYRHARADESARMGTLRGRLTYVCLSPFVGPEGAAALIAGLKPTAPENEDRGR